jgi:hypothetical protein
MTILGKPKFPIDDDVAMPAGRTKRGPKPNQRFAALDAKAASDFHAGLYETVWRAAHAYVCEYYPNLLEIQEHEKTKYIYNRLTEFLTN